MNDATEAPEADLALIDQVAELAARAYRADGRMDVTAFVAARAGSTPPLRMVTTPGLRTDLERRNFADAMRHLSIRTGSPRSAVAYGVWVVGRPGGAERIVEAGSRSKRPARARDAIVVSAESDEGQTEARLAVTRHANGRIDVDMEEAPRHTPRHAMRNRPMDLLRHHHVPTADRINPSVIAWAAGMDRHAERMLDVVE
jgi:hypothetical protein